MDAKRSIDGCTRLLGVMADPVDHARAPGAANALLASRGQQADFVLVPLHVAPSGLANALRGLRALRSFAGTLVSMPHKKAVMPLLDELTHRARHVGAVNVLRRDPDGRLVGDVLDGEGFALGLEAAGHRIDGSRCLMAGAGGAATAIAFALAERGCAALTLQDRTLAAAADLAARVRRACPQVDVRTDDAGGPLDYAINATSLGMQAGDALPLGDAVIRRARVVADVVVRPEMTLLLQRADAQGRQVHTGIRMLEAQIGLLLDFMGAGLPHSTTETNE